MSGSDAASGVFRGDPSDDPEFLELRREYLASLVADLAFLRESLRGGAPGRDTPQGREFRRKAHNLRGTGGAYGFPGITEAAGAVEDLHLGGRGVAALRRAVEALAGQVDAAARRV